MQHHEVVAVPRPSPYDFPGLLAWFAPRAVDGVEAVGPGSYARTLRLTHGAATVHVTDDPRRAALLVAVEASAPEDVPAAVSTVRHLFDTDTDPGVVDAHLRRHALLAPLVHASPGIRLPGSTGLPEALLRALVGQQITVAQARRLLTAAAATGEPVRSDVPGLTHLLPLPADLAETTPDWFRGPGARRSAIAGAMAALAGAPPPAPAELRRWLLALPGVGPWTADYVLMRAAHHPDVVPTPDVALRSGARRVGLAEDYRGILAALEPLRPWRSYAALHLWRAAA